MKRLLLAAVLAAAAVPAFAQVGVSVNIGEPGFYGQIDIGGAPPPQVLYPQPVVIQQGVVGGEPVYLHVPAGYAKHWRKHCAAYNACGRPVYFVRDDWYNKQYVPYYHQRNAPREMHEERGGPGPGERHDERDHERHDEHDHDHHD
jgi:hypothetical protein